MTEITPEMIEAACKQRFPSWDKWLQASRDTEMAIMRGVLDAALAAAPAPQPVAGSFTMSAAVQSVFPLAEREDNEAIAAALTAALGSDPYCWLAITGTAGESEGCSKFFFIEMLAKEYVQKHGGYIKPLYAAPSAEIDRLKAENERLKRLFDKQWERTREAGDLWRQAHPGNDLVSPDLGELVKWLMDSATAAEARIAELEAREKRMREALEKSKKLKSDKAKAIEALKAIKAGKEYDAYWTAEAALIGLGVIEGDK